MNKEPILLLFGKNVQKYRISQSLSQEKLAELAGVHRTYIGMIERAEKNITLCNIEKITKALNIEILFPFICMDRGEANSQIAEIEHKNIAIHLIIKRIAIIYIRKFCYIRSVKS